MKEEKNTDMEFDFDTPLVNGSTSGTSKSKVTTKTKETPNEETPINCLRNERVTVRFIARKRGSVTDPKHILYGGLHKSATRQLTVPLLRTGGFVNVLTKNEKDYLEQAMGLEPNALSVHKRENNFWDDANPNGIGKVLLGKEDTFLNLQDPIDYIKYKILLANSNIVAPSMQAYQDMPKATYEFVLISDKDSAKVATMNISYKQQAWMEFGRISTDANKLKIVIETIDGRPVASNTKLELLQTKVGELIESNPKTFINVVQDPLIDNKILIKRAIEAGIIANRGNYLYMRDSNTPLCDNGQEPTLNIAAKYLSLAKQQDLKFSIESKLKN